MLFKKTLHIVILFTAFFLASFPAFAQTLPGSADPSRVLPPQRPVPQNIQPEKLALPQIEGPIDLPDEAKNIRFQLKEIIIENATAFSAQELQDIYQPYLHQNISLEMIWMIAGRITERYRNAGYFLSRAYVPPQEIEGGVVTLKIVEGHIGDVQIDNQKTSQHHIIQSLITDIKNKKPIKADALEALMLRLNDLPGLTFRAFVEPMDDVDEGAVRLVLHDEKEKANTTIVLDNEGSRFLGPFQGLILHENSFIPLQQTVISVARTVFQNEMTHFSLEQSVPVHPNWTVVLSGLYTDTQPGFTLRPNDIQGQSYHFAIDMQWQLIRQRQENLKMSFGMSARNTKSDISGGTPLTRDRVRKMTAEVSYDTVHPWAGYHQINLQLARGLPVFGASDKNDPDLSRAEASPDFTSLKLDYLQQQTITPDVVALGRVSGQVASGPLFSSEEFGYGGKDFGRAYDPSELTGDHGIAGGLELRYVGLKPWRDVHFAPYVFYDIAKLWNEDAGSRPQSGASAGVGLQFYRGAKLSGNFGMAYALTRGIDNPIHGNRQGPRYSMQIQYRF